MKRYVALFALIALASAACFKINTSPTPVNSTSTKLGGIWVTIESIPGATAGGSCTNFRWAVTEFTGTTGAGTFSATCFSTNVQITGSASGTLSGTNVTWSANATATMEGLPPCAIALGGVAVLETDRIRVPYSGTTCLGPVSGTETIKR